MTRTCTTAKPEANDNFDWQGFIGGIQKAMTAISLIPNEIYCPSSWFNPDKPRLAAFNGVKLTVSPYMPKNTAFVFNAKQELVGMLKDGNYYPQRKPLSLKYQWST